MKAFRLAVLPGRSIPVLTFFVTAVLLAASSISALGANFYINASGPLGNGSGSSAANAADATPGKYNSLVQAQSTPGTVIIYAPGTYYDYPALSMYSGVTHQGAGIGSTIIKIPAGAASGSFTPMFLASGSTISNFKFTDVTIDFNSSNTAWWTQGTGKCIAFAFSLADHCTIQRVKFINIGAKNSESFPVFFNVGGSANGNMNNNLVDSCIFTQPIVSGNTGGGLTCVQMADALPGITTDTTNVVSNNQFLALKYPEYSDLGYAQCCSCPMAINNQASGVDSLWFVEPGSSGSGQIATFTNVNVQVTGNRLTDSGDVAFILMHPNGTFGGNLSIQNNSVGMTQSPYKFQGPSVPTGCAVATYQAGNSSVGNITVQGNTFIAPLPTMSPPVAIQANPASPDFFHLASLSVLDNVYINFPTAGAENNITTNPIYNPNYTNTGNSDNKQINKVAVADWALDEATGPSSYDSSPDQITGTWESNPVFSASIPSGLPFSDAGSLSFNGTSQYVDMGTPAVLPAGTSARTLCGWGKPDNTGNGYRCMASYDSPHPSQAMYIGMNGATLVAGGYGDDLTVPNFWDTNWHFIALTYDGQTANLFADGKLVASAAKTWSLVSSRCYIGRQVDGTDDWSGLIDDVRIYNDALSSSQLAAISTTITVPRITSQPQSVTALLGGSAAFSVAATGTGLTYQWKFNGTSLSGQTAAALSLANLTQQQAGSYLVVVTDAAGTATSGTATLTVTAGYAQWADQYFSAQQQASPSISASGSTPWNDGVPNLLKYVFDIDPSRPMTAGGRAALPSVAMTTAGGTPYLTLSYRLNPLAAGITLSVQTSPELETWTTVTSPATVQTGIDPGTGDPIIQVQLPAASTREFARLSVTEP